MDIIIGMLVTYLTLGIIAVVLSNLLDSEDIGEILCLILAWWLLPIVILIRRFKKR